MSFATMLVCLAVFDAVFNGISIYLIYNIFGATIAISFFGLYTALRRDIVFTFPPVALFLLIGVATMVL